jgi:hypothetical protein
LAADRFLLGHRSLLLVPPFSLVDGCLSFCKVWQGFIICNFIFEDGLLATL